MLHTSQLDWPVDWMALFGRQAPLCIEIGFGGGHFLVDLAQKRPDINFIGCEISLPSMRKAARKSRTLGLTNIQLVQGDAWQLLWAHCDVEIFDAVYINFPDPWPKAGHQHRRLISERFLALLATRMKPQAVLEIATDHADYAEVITACLEATPYFESRLPTTYVVEDRKRIRTKYEQKGLDEGRVCHYYKWQRNDASAPNLFAIPKELSMPHVVMQSPLSLSEIQAQFSPKVFTHDETQIKLMAVYLSQNGQQMLVDAYINEEPVKQRIGLSIRQRDIGDIVLGLHELGFPRPTLGAHWAIYDLAEWVRGLHGETAVVKSNLQVAMEEGV